MFRPAISCVCRNYRNIAIVNRRYLLQDAYKCSEAWSGRLNSEILQKIKVDELYYDLEQKYTRTGNISAIDVDIFVNAVDNSQYVDELRDILHKLRMTNETVNTLDSTHYAIVRHFIDFDRTDDLLNILDDRLNYGIFLDMHSANLLLDHFIRRNDFKSAARTASFLMLQEDFLSPLTSEMCLIACLMYLSDPQPFYPKEEVKIVAAPVKTKKKVEEIKIRVGFIRNPYFDDHFDLKSENDLVGKTISMLSKRQNNVEGLNGELIGCTLYRKYDKLQLCMEKIKASPKAQVFKETISVLEDKLNNEEFKEGHEVMNKVLKNLVILPVSETTLLECAKERALKEVKATENDFIQDQLKILSMWEETRKVKLQEQIIRLDKAKRIEHIENKQKALQSEEEKLWFFENEENIDLEIEKKKLKDDSEKTYDKTKLSKEELAEYIPPEIFNRKRR